MRVACKPSLQSLKGYAEPLQANLPAITPPRKKSPLSSSVRRLGAAADMDAGRENVSARAVCTAAPSMTLLDHSR